MTTRGGLLWPGRASQLAPLSLSVRGALLLIEDEGSGQHAHVFNLRNGALVHASRGTSAVWVPE